ncbi:hypothetical protein H2200_004276 [Cladophialophora chaetospira]|uniref:Uncharacterized protein n=1 Tax=Cladophialophora chaetospira TaxID=386627 RepID=A0AA38XCU5_9EURO|nr:hypothetical protein H2200_004276 [Cladophialophora chaetospira]
MENTNEIISPPTAARKTRRLTPLTSQTVSKQRKMGTLQFEELNLGSEKPLPVCKEPFLSRKTSFDSLKDRQSGNRSVNLGLWWTTAVVGLPILDFTAALLALVSMYRVQSDTTHPFGVPTTSHIHSRSILVDFSATRLAFIASWSSTLAPMLLGSLMALWHIPTAARLASATTKEDQHDLPTPHQVSMLIGLASGSLDELRKYFVYRFTKVRAEQPRMLTRSVMVLIISSLLALLIFCADTAIHAFTFTVPFSKIRLQDRPLNAFGRGLTGECINFDRETNQGLPCTVVADVSVGSNVIARDAGEIISLQRNVSSHNSIWTIQDNDLKHGDLLILMPQIGNTPSNVDYRATTVGVSTQCSPSSKQCNVRMAGGTTAETSYVVFNCTDHFRGVLGASPSISNDTIDWTHTDPTTPDFNFKYDRNFQYAYFSDPAFDTIYNSIGGNATNGGASGALAMPDNELINPIYLATAGLIPVQNGAAGESLSKDPGVFSLGGGLVAYTLACVATSYDVSYDWINGTIASFDYTATTNGSIIELAHGMQATGMPALSQAQSLASLSASAMALARSFANQHSENSLTLIGSVMSARANIAEATRENLLVAKMSSGAFGFLIGSNLLYVIFGFVLVIRAWQLDSPETRDMVARLSVEGLTAMAFEDTLEKKARRVDEVNNLFEESRIGDSSRRVGLKAYSGGGHIMFVEQPRL